MIIDNVHGRLRYPDFDSDLSHRRLQMPFSEAIIERVPIAESVDK